MRGDEGGGWSVIRHGPVKGGASTFDIMRDVCARAPARRGAQQSCAGRVGVAGAVEEHVEGVLEWGVVAAAELVVVGGVLASACGEVRISDQAGPEPALLFFFAGAPQSAVLLPAHFSEVGLFLYSRGY